MSTLKSSAEDLTLNADGSGNDVIIQSNGSTKAIITAEGKVGIGESSPLCGVGGLHIKDGDSGLGSVNSNFDNFIIEGDGRTGMNILAGASSESIIGFSDTGGHQGVIRYDHSTNRMQFSTNDVTKLSILSGGGITFGSDTAAANALDDYEEGTCSIKYSDGVTSVGTDDNFAYTKVGRVVTVSGSISPTDITGLTGSSNLGLTGFPFTFATVGSFALLTRNLDAPANCNSVLGYHPHSSTTMEIWFVIDHANYARAACEDIDDTVNDLYFAVTYQAT